MIFFSTAINIVGDIRQKGILGVHQREHATHEEHVSREHYVSFLSPCWCIEALVFGSQSVIVARKRCSVVRVTEFGV